MDSHRSAGTPFLPLVVTGACLAVLVALVVYLAAGPIMTEDFWFHLKMGEVYATQGLWPAGDPLLHTARAEAPIQHEWLFGVMTYGIEQAFGFHGVRLVHGVVVLAILWLAYSLFRRQSPGPALAAFATAVFLVLAFLRIVQFRPDLVSIPATLLLYRLLLEPEEPPSWARVGASLVLLLVWVNAHSLFAVGLLLLAAALIALGVEAVSIGWSSARQRTRAARLAVALGLGLLVTLLNPRGIHQHLTFIAFSRGSGIWQISDEWEPFNPFARGRFLEMMGLLGWALMDAVLIAFVLALVVAILRLRRRPATDGAPAVDSVLVGVGVASIVATLVSIRFLWMAVFPLLLVLRVLRLVLADAPGSARPVAWVSAGASIVLAAAFAWTGAFPMVAANLPAQVSAYLSQPYIGHKYHLAGVEFLRDTGVEGNLFNKYPMGGFLEFWLAPRLRTFIDGRTADYPPEVLQDYIAVTEQRGVRPGETFTDILDRRQVDLFFGVGVPFGAAPDWIFNTSTHLENVPGWILVSRSVHHAIYLRANDRNRENLQRIAAYYAREGVPFDAERGVDPEAAAQTRPDWAVAHEMLPPEPARLLSVPETADATTRARALNELGFVYTLLGAYAAEERTDRAAVTLRPDLVAARRRLVYSLLRQDRPDEARLAARELRQADPQDPRSETIERAAEAYAARRARSLIDRLPLVTPEEQQWLLGAFHHTTLP